MYYELTFTIKEPLEENGEIVASMLNEIGYETAQEKDQLNAFIEEQALEKIILEETIANLCELKMVELDFKKELIEKVNWNQLWESNFEAITIPDVCHIRANFHEAFKDELIELVINPKMSFGTGHHATTFLALQMLSTLDLKDKRCLDMGTGTGILAIYAIKRGAKYVLAIDNDEWSVENSLENITINEVSKQIDGLLGDAHHIAEELPFHIVIANINRNILLHDMELYVAKIKPKGALIISGFYTQDVEILLEKAKTLNLIETNRLTKDNWVCLSFNL